jgi:hypothetical protein
MSPVKLTPQQEAVLRAVQHPRPQDVADVGRSTGLAKTVIEATLTSLQASSLAELYTGPIVGYRATESGIVALQHPKVWPWD